LGDFEMASRACDVPWRLLRGHTRGGSEIKHGGNGGKQEVAVAPHC
jgi:hypothetical protein